MGAVYFKLSEVKNVFEELDGWVRRRLRLILWRQWKRSYTRARKLMQRGLSEARSWKSATNGHGPWWNSGASHMNEAFPKKYFETLFHFYFISISKHLGARSSRLQGSLQNGRILRICFEIEMELGLVSLLDHYHKLQCAT